MNKEIKKNKKLYIALLVFSIAAIIAIVTTSIVIGLNSGAHTPVDNPIGPVQEPDDKVDDVVTPPDETTDPTDPDEDKPVVNPVKYGMPLSSYTAGQEYNVSDMVWSNTLQWFETHNGTDFIADAGSIVTSICDGTVKSVSYSTQNGYVIAIENSDGNTAFYMSLSDNTLVAEGASVARGSQIGFVSDSMQKEQNEGAHLHLEILDKNGEYVDPMSLLPASSTDK